MSDPWLEGIVQKQAMADKPTLGGQIPDHALEILTARKRIAELKRENAELRKDADRYRMLRANAVKLLPEDMRRKLIDVGCSTEYDAEVLDAFLDAAIASEKENERG